MLNTSYIELSKSALHNNISFINKIAGEEVVHSMVLKANAYGHGIDDLVPMIEDCGLTHFSVFSVAEAMRVQKVKKEECEIMLMGWVDDDYIEWAIENDVSFFVFTMDRLKKTVEVAAQTQKPARIHIELETGMHRTGFSIDQLDRVVSLVQSNDENIIVEGLCTHYAGAEHLDNHNRILNQIDTYKRLCNQLQKRGMEPRFHHTACSAALLNYPETSMDLVRIGIADYGFWPSPESKMRYLIKNEDADPDGPLKRVLSWKSKVMSVNHADQGEYISYGKSYRTNRPSLIATVPVGYGYGFNRTLSNNGHVLIDEKRAPVIGTVNMNMVVVDVTEVGEKVQVGDEVVLIGTQGPLEISVSSFGEMNNSLNYELLTRLPNHIPRKIID